VSCALGAFLGGSQGGECIPPLVKCIVWASAPNFFLEEVFAIFSSLLKIILVLGIRVLVSTEYLKTLYILYSEW
jgi:hypothetical protein